MLRNCIGLLFWNEKNNCVWKFFCIEIDANSVLSVSDSLVTLEAFIVTTFIWHLIIRQ